MIKLGTTQKLIIDRIKKQGAYLVTLDNENEDVLLPTKQIPVGKSPGDDIEVFVYKDSEDRPIATTIKPMLELGDIAYLEVVETNKYGAFLDWGLPKDLFLPFKEQTNPVEPHQKVLITLYVDKSSRLCASMNIHRNLSSDSPYKRNDKVTGTIYDISETLGVLVAVDQKYYGLIQKKDVFKRYKVGEKIEARVSQVREDGKLNLSTKDEIHIQMKEDTEIILEKLELNNGFIPFNDDTKAEIIYAEFKMSKSAFKRSVGSLLKEKKVFFYRNGIKLREDE